MGNKQLTQTIARTKADSITFTVDDVNLGLIKYKKFVKPSGIFSKLLDKNETLIGSGIAIDDSRDWLSSYHHGFFFSAFHAFDKHFPLIISPDHIIQLILEGWSQHVNRYSVELRHRFMKNPQVFNLINSSCESTDFDGLITSISKQIQENTKEDFYSIITSRYTTTTNSTLLARHIALMGIVKKNFKYNLNMRCGIPQITLLGKIDDWILVKTHLTSLKPYMMPDFAKLWIPALHSMIDKFIETYNDNADKLFWKSMIVYDPLKEKHDSLISGWINILFPYPYADGMYMNKYCIPWDDLRKTIDDNIDIFKGMSIEFFENFFCSATIKCNHDKYQTIKSGFIGATQNDEGIIIPQISWFITTHEKPS